MNVSDELRAMMFDKALHNRKFYLEVESHLVSLFQDGPEIYGQLVEYISACDLHSLQYIYFLKEFIKCCMTKDTTNLNRICILNMKSDDPVKRFLSRCVTDNMDIRIKKGKQWMTLN